MPPEIPAFVPDITAVITLPLQFSIPSHILVLAFALVGAFWATMTVIYLYHWRRFPYDKPFLKMGERIYVAGSVVCIVIALGGIIVS